MNDTKQHHSPADEEITILADKANDDEDETVVAASRSAHQAGGIQTRRNAPVEVSFADDAQASRRRAISINLLLPSVLLTVTLLGGLRLASTDSSFVFLPPPLLCLIFAVMLIALFARAGIVRLGRWFSNSYSLFRNAANGWLLFTLFAASAQVFNSLIPEQGMLFWVVGFCFFWTLWNNLFADFDSKRLIRSLGALFGLAFVVKYLVLANLAAPEGGSWLGRIIENPGKEAFTWLLDLPRYSAGTGYIQFFTAVLYFLALLVLPPDPNEQRSGLDVDLQP